MLVGNKVADKLPVKAIRVTAAIVFATLGGYSRLLASTGETVCDADGPSTRLVPYSALSSLPRLFGLPGRTRARRPPRSKTPAPILQERR